MDRTSVRLVFIISILSGLIAAAEPPLPYCQANLPSTVLRGPKGYSLAFVQVIIRHGDRTPGYEMKPDFNGGNSPAWKCNLNQLSKPGHSRESTVEQPNRLFRTVFEGGKELLKGNCNLGQLTDKGYRQHLRLGEHFRKVYSKSGVLDDLKAMKVRSTDVFRTLQSAMALLTGLFPTNSSSQVTEVIEIVTRDKEVEDMTPDHACPAWKVALDKLYTTKYWIDFHKSARYLDFQSSLRSKFNVTYSPDVYALFDHYTARVCHGFPLPASVNASFLAEITSIETWEWNFSLFPFNMGKLGMGKFISTLLNNVLDFVNGKSRETKFRLFSGHDTTIAPLLAALGMFDGAWPPYASHIELELWRGKNDKFLLGFKYNGQSFFLPKCNSYYCDIKTLKLWWGEMVPTQAECQQGLQD